MKGVIPINSPIILNKLPFDAEIGAIVQFRYSGNQIFANRLVIKDNSTNEVVYDEKKDVQVEYTNIPANTLTNGNTYNVQISVFDHDDVESPLSNPVVLKCLKTPTFGFENITDSMIVRNSYVDANVLYSQENGELLNTYTVNVYAQNQTTVVFTSGTKLSNDLTVRVPQLTDDTTYYIKAIGQTVNGIELATPMIAFTCDYVKPDLFLTFRADNIADEGSVKLSSNFVLVEGSSNVEELIYIDGSVDLTNGEKVVWDKGYEVGDFVEQIKVKNIPDFTKFTTRNMKSAMVYMTWNYGYFNGSTEKSYYIELISYQYVGGRLIRYIQSSNLVEPLQDNEWLHIWVKHEGNLFDVIITKLESGDST